jgi:TolB-like protein
MEKQNKNVSIFFFKKNLKIWTFWNIKMKTLKTTENLKIQKNTNGIKISTISQFSDPSRREMRKEGVSECIIMKLTLTREIFVSMSSW